MTTSKNHKEITFQLSLNLDEELKKLEEKFGYSKSELINIAIEDFLQNKNQNKLEKAVELMYDEYEKGDDLASFTQLDGEPFYVAG